MNKKKQGIHIPNYKWLVGWLVCQRTGASRWLLTALPHTLTNIISTICIRLIENCIELHAVIFFVEYSTLHNSGVRGVR